MYASWANNGELGCFGQTSQRVVERSDRKDRIGGSFPSSALNCGFIPTSSNDLYFTSIREPLN